jgi:perosamine synthetase
MKKLIPISEPSLGEEELNNVVEAVKSSWISSIGRFIPEFEQGFAEYCGTKYGIATSNGTTSLHLALVTLGIGAGDEVIVPTLTFVATANAVAYCNARPVFVDSHPDYWCMDPARIEEKITKKTKAILPVHLYGHPCDMDAITRIARKHNLYVIEDAAEAHGAEYKGKKVGSFGDISCFSFYGNKIITTGEGGMCLTDDPKLADKMKGLRDHGMNPHKRYWHDYIGYNYRITNMQAAVGVAQLSKMDSFLKKRAQIRGWYDSFLQDVKGITLQPEMNWAKSICWMYCLLLDNKFIDRDNLMKALKEEGIDTRPFFYPLHVLPPYDKGEKHRVAEELASQGINLPSSVKLDKPTVKKIADTVIRIMKS